jgi:L-malate glycosyltransferase
MRIGIVSTLEHSPWGGSEVLWARMAEAALDRGHEVALLRKHWPEQPPAIRALQDRGAVLFARTADPGSRWGRAFERHVRPFPALIRWGPEAILVNQGGFYDLMLRGDIPRLLAAIGAPYTPLFQQVYDFQFPIYGDYARGALAGYCLRARRVAFVAEGNRRAAERQLATSLPNARVVRNPTNLAGDDAVPWPPAGAGPARLASSARLEVNDKGQDVLLECLAGDAWRGRDWELNLYGKGDGRGYLEALARHYGIADRVRFRGHVGDLRSIWRENHLHLLPSRVEGTPLSLVEAMICGRPSVVTDVGGNAEWVAEPRNGFLAEAPTPRSFGAALERAWAARGGWESQGEAARREALRLVDPDPAGTLLDLVVDPDRLDARGPAGRRPSAALEPSGQVAS